MKTSESFGTVLLGIWLILTGLFALLPVYIPAVVDVLPLAALVAGILLLVTSASLPRSIGIFLLALWLILKGLMPYLLISLPYRGGLTDILAVVAGILILVRK